MDFLQSKWSGAAQNSCTNIKNNNQEYTNTEIRSKGSADGLVRCLRGEPDGLPGLTSVSWAHSAPLAEDENYNNQNHDYTNTNR